MHRTLLITLMVAVLAATATADVLVVKRGNSYKFIGLKSKIRGVEITIANFRAFLDESTGVIEREGYTGVWAKKTARGASKSVMYPLSEVVSVHYTTEPDALLDGYDFMSTGNWAQAIGAFRRAAGDPEVRPVYKTEAQFFHGICYVRGGSTSQAAKYFAGWKIGDSKYTPQVYRLMGEIQASRKKFGDARTWYQKISALAGISRSWKFRARLGETKVDIEEQKFDAAEGNARAIAREIGSAKELRDPLALAYALQGKAILASGKKPRYPEAQKLLGQAVALDGVSDTNMAVAYSALGDAIYAQGKPEDARFAYMRVVCLYPGEASYVANALLNAGQCLLDMSGRTKAKGELSKSDDLLIQGMKLLRECAGRHKGSGAGRQAAVAYRRHKKDFEEAQQRQEGADDSEEPSKPG